MDAYVGTSGFSYKEWLGPFYPEKLKPAEMLGFYGREFNTVEINNTFYRLPRRDVLERWSADVPESFRFVIKASRRLTHRSRLKNVAEPLSFLVEGLAAIEARMGALLVQLPPNLKQDCGLLEAFLAQVPRWLKVALEVRHRSWLAGDTYEVLRARDAALVISDEREHLEVPFVGTASWGYLRLRAVEYSDEDFLGWSDQVRRQGWQQVFAFLKHEQRAPELARRFRELLVS